MSVGISFNPMDIMNYAQQDKQFSDQMNLATYQQRTDNAFRNTQFQNQEAWNWRQWNDRKFKIQTLVKDAKKAGISPLAALGSGGASPANISVPVGQGGRVAGTYQRRSPMQAQVNLQSESPNSHLQTLSFEEEVRGRRLDNGIKNIEYNRKLEEYYRYMKGEKPPPLYKRYSNNYDEAVRWTSDGYVPVVNPEANMEMPEHVGGYYFYKPKPEGFLNP